jgi:hypothetical protein
MEFVTHGYGGIMCKFFVGMDMQYPYLLPGGYLTCGPFGFNPYTLSQFLILLNHSILTQVGQAHAM